jgi:hypothetical protein
VTRALAVIGVAVLAALGGCGDDDTASPGTSTTSPAEERLDTTTTTAPPDDEPVETTVTTDATTTTTPTTSTSAPPASEPAHGPGDPCVLGTTDCVDDAWGDGVARLIVGHEDCVEAIGESGLCDDLDQDGYAGYPDSG